MKKILLLTTLCLLITSASFAQTGYYRAIIYNFNDGEPILGAEIFLDTAKTPLKLTDSNGFLAVLIKSGKHTIRIESENKVNQTRQITIKKDLILSESIFLFSKEDDIINCDSINSPKFADKSFLNNSDTLNINGNSLVAEEAFIRIGYDVKGVRCVMTVILPVNYALSSKELEVTKVYVSFGGMLYSTDEVISRSGLFKLKQKEESVFYVNFEAPPWTGESVEVILEILNSGKKQYLKYNKGISIYPSEER